MTSYSSPVLGYINTCLVFLNRVKSQLSTDTKQAHITVSCVVVRQGTTRKVERRFSPSTSGRIDSDQTAPKSDCSNVYILGHILKNMQPIELGVVATDLKRMWLLYIIIISMYNKYFVRYWHIRSYPLFLGHTV